MISGILLYIPLPVIGFIHFVGSGRATLGTAILAALLGGSYHFTRSQIIAGAHAHKPSVSVSVI